MFRYFDLWMLLIKNKSHINCLFAKIFVILFSCNYSENRNLLYQHLAVYAPCDSVKFKCKTAKKKKLRRYVTAGTLVCFNISKEYFVHFRFAVCVACDLIPMEETLYMNAMKTPATHYKSILMLYASMAKLFIALLVEIYDGCYLNFDISKEYFFHFRFAICQTVFIIVVIVYHLTLFPSRKHIRLHNL